MRLPLPALSWRADRARAAEIGTLVARRGRPLADTRLPVRLPIVSSPLRFRPVLEEGASNRLSTRTVSNATVGESAWSFSLARVPLWVTGTFFQ